jgi:predicted RNA-binding Zn ribbon-like protein
MVFPTNKPSATPPFVFLAHQGAIDFINTQMMMNNEPLDLIKDFSDFVSWLVAAHMLSKENAAEIKQKWDKKPFASEILQQALELRKIIDSSVKHIVNKKPVANTTITKINDLLRYKSGYGEMVAAEDGYKKQFHAIVDEPKHLLIPIAEAFADLLCHCDLSLVRKCKNPQCVLHFYDTTKNHKRRWCIMSMCGNRIKAAAHYQRKKLGVKKTKSNPA